MSSSISSSINDGIEVSPAHEKPSPTMAFATVTEALPEGPRPHKSVQAMPLEAPPFKWSSLWEDPVVNPINLKSYTLPIFNLRNPYTRNFHLAWLSFFVAFLSWFAFPPLIPEAIKEDLKLTQPQIGNSNIVALSATLILRLVMGPLVDRFGPRLTMAGILIVGAIPSGLAGTVTSAQGLYVLRFFIGILGATFVPCVAWQNCFFDKSINGAASAFTGGWGNMGGGVTYVVMTALYYKLRETLTQHVAWRVAFVVVPVPILLFVAALVLIFGTDHPSGKWSQRHTMPATAAAILRGHEIKVDSAEKVVLAEKKQEPAAGVEVNEVNEDADAREEAAAKKDEIDVAVNEALTVRSAITILTNPLTWLPALGYLTTFGSELAVDSNLGHDILLSHPRLGMLNAGYYASIYGFLNLVTRPAGGIIADMLYKRFGVKSKVYWMIGLGLGQGIFSIAFGFWLQHTADPSLAGMMLFIVVIAFFNEAANGANFALVPHCNVYSNGVMSGLVGSMGNAGGILFALVWRFRPSAGVPYWISGIIALGINALLILFPKPRS